MSRAFVNEDAGGSEPRYRLPSRDDPGYDEAAAWALLQGANAGDSYSAELATGYRGGGPGRRPPGGPPRGRHRRRLLPGRAGDRVPVGRARAPAPRGADPRAGAGGEERAGGAAGGAGSRGNPRKDRPGEHTAE